MTTKLRYVSPLILSLLVGCATRLGDLALGKVVVYRNGVAYFERYANVEDGELSLLIAQSKVNDLLKSLKVQDAESGKLLPVSFPGRSEGQGIVRMRIRVEGKATRKVKISYVSESPAWKPSYRLNLGENGKVGLQGWAIVDNTSGEDWKNVKIGVGSTSALSFRYDLWSVRDVHRQTLGQDQRLATAPPTATGLAGQPAASDATSTTQAITLDADYTRNIPVPGRVFESAIQSAAGTAGDTLGVSFSGSTSLENQYVIDGVNTTSISFGTRGVKARSEKERAEEAKRRAEQLYQRQVASAEAAKIQRRNDELATQLRGGEDKFIIEGVASPSEPNGQAVALSMANRLRNELIERGVPPLRLSVETRVGQVGEPTTLVVKPVKQATASDPDDGIIGESKFVSPTTVSIPHEGSSMVSIADVQAHGEVVYLYDATSLHGNSDYAFKSVRFENPTKQHLEGGPVTVFGDDTFVGEGLTEGIAPGASAILPFALDKQVHVSREESYVDTVVGIDRVLDDGVIVDKTRLNTIGYSIHNRSHESTTVYIRHDADRGWTLKEGPKNLEQLGRMSVFPVELAAGEKKTVALVESTPLTATLDLTADEGVDALAAYLRANKDDTVFTKTAERLVTAHRSISNDLRRIDFAAGQLVLFRSHLDDLHAQIVTLELVNSKGKLVRNLQERMAAMAARAQDTVMEIVNLQEKIMLERFAYRDLIAELAAL